MNKKHTQFSTKLRPAVLAMLPLLSVSHLAAAQSDSNTSVVDEEPRILEEVVVKGFSSSLKNAIEVKRQADSVVEVISAEDLGRLPDVSIAEALSRLPGITSQRVNGQSSAINIRGLSQSLTFSTLNGREQVTPNGNRSIEFEQFPSELIAGATIYKTPTASLIEGGLAGTVELRTLRPLDQQSPRGNINLRLSYNDRADEIFDADEMGYRFSTSYTSKIGDDFGYSLGYARLEQPDVSTRFVGFDYEGASTDFNGDGINDSVPFGFEVEEQGGTDTRDGVIGTLQWRLNDSLTWDLDGYYSKFESESFGRGIRVIGTQEANRTSTQVSNPVVVNNALVGGFFSRNVGAPTAANGGGFGLTPQVINDNQSDDDELVSLGTKLAFENDVWAASLDLSYSKAESEFANEVSAILPLTGVTGGVPGVSNNSASTPLLATDFGVQVQFNGTDIPNLAFNNDFTDRSRFFLSRFGAFPFVNEDELNAVALDFSRALNAGPLASIDFGVRVSEREASQFRESADFGNDAGFFQFAPELSPVALTPENSSVECFSGEFANRGAPCFLVVADPRALAEGAVGTITPDQSQGFTRTESYTVSEDVTSAYVQLNIDTELGAIPVTGNIGLRYVDTDQESQSQALPQASGLEFSETLYSANLIFGLTEQDQVRFGVSRALSRAPLNQLGSGFNVSFNTQQNRLTGGGSGNPALLPFIADQVDLSYEHYFDQGGIFTVAGFYKSLDSFIVNETNENFDFGESNFLSFLTPIQRAQLDAAGVNFIGQFGGPINGEGGFVRGLELAYTQTFDALPAPWNGLGVNLNYSYTSSEIEFTASNSGQSLDLPLPGLSTNVLNATLFYENEGFSNRIGIRYRDEFISPQIGINSQLPFTDDELVIDYQASYEFRAGALDGITVLFQANNLTDQEVATYFGTTAQTGTVQFFGRQYFIGASYNF